MNRKRNIITALLLVFALALMAGCGAKPQEPAAPANEPDPQPAQAPAAPEGPEDQGEPDDGRIHVSSMEELAEAIAPGADIVLEPGDYDPCMYAQSVWEGDYDKWSGSHRYLDVTEVYDGYQLHIMSVRGLKLSGGSDDCHDVNLIVGPRYAAVLTFQDCDELSLSGLTMGHTDRGECSGNVIDLFGCNGVKMDNMDIFGCGVTGVYAQDGCSDFEIANSTLRDCESGPFDIVNSSGGFVFKDCSLTGSGGGGYLDYMSKTDLKFVRCSFGENESNRWYFDESAEFEDCEWSEITEYPDYSGWEDYEGEDYSGYDPATTYDPANFDYASFEIFPVTEIAWYAYTEVNPESGEETYIPYESDVESVIFEFYEDGSGGYTISEKYTAFDWSYLDPQSVKIIDEKGNTLYASLYETPEFGGESWFWLRVDTDESVYWCF